MKVTKKKKKKKKNNELLKIASENNLEMPKEINIATKYLGGQDPKTA